ncbi:DUF1109 domain-containing protein [Kaistia geumhonensis]|uniref:DUF1109 family protein n=1 Tax=Kaistia geumhonensis TaxID=410839 RepID=A0ABU0M8T0_9HYPH|nr:DUF1109 domain-containing protein [Kaistia geumhonensis]MCX5477624.1 DUF1109 domain-containing protein [Kaistia geumhonensis]MDQ0517168.1 hypothetical protein [Kaistia geumhonensis]
MRTDDLIRAMAEDERRAPAPARAVALLLPAGLIGAALLFVLFLRVRPDLAGAMMTPRLMVKFGFTVSLAIAAMAVVLAMVRPGQRSAPRAVALFLPFGILALGVAGELGAMGPDSWMPGLMGHNARYCVVLVPLMAAPVLAALLIAFRQGAPTRPALAGAVAGLAAGGIGATLYAFHCTDDSPLFVLVWYGIGIAAVTAVGAVIGRRLLAW